MEASMCAGRIKYGNGMKNRKICKAFYIRAVMGGRRFGRLFIRWPAYGSLPLMWYAQGNIFPYVIIFGEMMECVY